MEAVLGFEERVSFGGHRFPARALRLVFARYIEDYGGGSKGGYEEGRDGLRQAIDNDDVVAWRARDGSVFLAIRDWVAVFDEGRGEFSPVDLPEEYRSEVREWQRRNVGRRK